MNKAGSLLILLASIVMAGCSNHNGSNKIPVVPQEISTIFNKDIYRDSTWAMRVVDMESGEIAFDQNSDENLFIGSVRKVSTIAAALAVEREYLTQDVGIPGSEFFIC